MNAAACPEGRGEVGDGDGGLEEAEVEVVNGRLVDLERRQEPEGVGARALEDRNRSGGIGSNLARTGSQIVGGGLDARLSLQQRPDALPGSLVLLHVGLPLRHHFRFLELRLLQLVVDLVCVVHSRRLFVVFLVLKRGETGIKIWLNLGITITPGLKEMLLHS